MYKNRVSEITTGPKIELSSFETLIRKYYSLARGIT